MMEELSNDVMMDELNDVKNKQSHGFEDEDAKLPMALFTMDRSSKKRLLFDVTSRTIRGLTSSVFPDATCAFENGGWLLMVQHQRNPLGFVEQAVFLVHPSTGAQLNLPALSSCSSSQGLFVFYVNSHGAPLVVARVEALSLVPTAHVACPGDLFWSVYKHDVAGVEMEMEPPPCESRAPRRRRLVEPVSIADVALVGTRAVCLDAGGDVLVFDVAEMAWRRRTPAVRPDAGTAQYARSLVAAGGEVMLVSRPRAVGDAAFRFFRLDMGELEWSPLDRRELDDTSWFLRKGQSFRAKDPGKRRVYVFGGGGGDSTSTTAEADVGDGSMGHGASLKSITNVYAYDLDYGSVEMVIPASIVTEGYHWVRPSVFATPAAR